MLSSHIKYHQGFKYQTTEDSVFNVACKPQRNAITQFITLTTAGVLTIKCGYAWDGPSGITIDTKNFMRGSLVHDALYQLMRNGHLALSEKKNADDELIRLCKEDGMWGIRRWWVYRALYRFGKSATLPENKRKTHTAP